MPDGVMKWYDPKQDRGVVEHNGREYTAQASDIESHARRTGAPVHFDIDRQRGDGDVAVRVELRAGSRTSRRHQRAGDLVGARNPAEKGQDEEVDLNDLSVRRRAYGEKPALLVQDWVRLLSGGQVDRAAHLYAPGAVIHEGERDVAGDADLRRWLETSALVGAPNGGADVVGSGPGEFTVTWRTLPGEQVAVVSRLRVANGRITEQWTAEAG